MLWFIYVLLRCAKISSPTTRFALLSLAKQAQWVRFEQGNQGLKFVHDIDMYKHHAQHLHVSGAELECSNGV
jgi:hypothetical protein